MATVRFLTIMRLGREAQLKPEGFASSTVLQWGGEGARGVVEKDQGE